MQAYLIKSLKKIRKEARLRQRQLKDEIDAVIGKLDSDSHDNDADNFFGVLKLTCESKTPKVVEFSLDCIHYLIEHGYLRGNKTIPAPINDSEVTKTETTHRMLIDEIVETVCLCSEMTEDGVQLGVIKVLLTAITARSCEIHEGSLLLAIRACYNIHLVSRNAVNRTTAKASLTQMLNIVIGRMESFDTQVSSSSSSIQSNANDSKRNDNDDQLPPNVLESDRTSESLGRFQSIFHKDAFLLFRALCKLSMKRIDDDSSSDPIALESKSLSLELILQSLEQAGPAFHHHDRFIAVVKSYLCQSLLENCTCHIAKIVGLSLRIFIALSSRFREQLKTEIEIFVSDIFLRILESENSTHDHKLQVLQMFSDISREPQSLVEIFVNYDCDMNAINLFFRMVDGMAKTAKGRIGAEDTSASESTSSGSGIWGSQDETNDFLYSANSQSGASLQRIALEGIVELVHSLVRASGLELESQSMVNSESTYKQKPVILQDNNQELNVADDNGSDNDDPNHSTASVKLVGDDDMVQTFDRKLKLQQQFQLGLLRFNQNPKKGIAYFGTCNLVDSSSPKSVAQFLIDNRDKLDKTAIGDYLGKEKEYEGGFCIRVLHEYVNLSDFEGKLFDVGIRDFLSGFRLPGEAQKIDRIMEKFAERYCKQNPSIFESADTAFILAFSVIMLQTDLHNPAIKEERRMTKSGFIRNNRGISNGGDLPEAFLGDVFDRIALAPISLKEDEDVRVKTASKVQSDPLAIVFNVISGDKTRKEAFVREREDIIRSSGAAFKHRSVKQSAFVKMEFIDDAHVKAMFEATWAPILSAISTVLETTEDATMTSLCLKAFTNSIRICSYFAITPARDAFVNGLTKFTTLDTIRQMSRKNIDCIKALIYVAMSDGNFLRESWSQILGCISHLSRLHLFANGLHTDDMFFADNASSSSTSKQSSSNPIVSKSSLQKKNKTMMMNVDISRLFSTPTPAEAGRIVEEINAEQITHEIDNIAIDKVFTNSVSLSTDAIQYFVTQLCEVSKSELCLSSQAMGAYRSTELKGDLGLPRIFSLQKIVEVADFNMASRPRIVWSYIWRVLSEYFCLVGLHESESIAMFAVDSMRQLAIKFLAKEELRDFNFQRLFMKPFEIVASRSRSVIIIDLIVRCIDNIIQVRAPNIRSGWKSVFSVLSSVVDDVDLEIPTLAFDILDRLLSQQFPLLVFHFSELIHCLAVFASSRHSEISLESIKWMKFVSRNLADPDVMRPAFEDESLFRGRSNTTENSSAYLSVPINDLAVGETEAFNMEDDRVFTLWWPLLLGLSSLVGDERLHVRSAALAVLHDVLRLYAAKSFTPQAWKIVFKGILFPIMDNCRLYEIDQDQGHDNDVVINVICSVWLISLKYSSLYPSQPFPRTQNMQSWIATTSESVLSVIMQLFFQNKQNLLHLIIDVFSLIQRTVCQELEILGRIGVRTLGDFVLGLEKDDCIGMWDELVDRLVQCLASNLIISFSSKNVTQTSGSNSFPFQDLILSNDAKIILDLDRQHTQPSVQQYVVLNSFDIERLIDRFGQTTDRPASALVSGMVPLKKYDNDDDNSDFSGEIVSDEQMDNIGSNVQTVYGIGKLESCLVLKDEAIRKSVIRLKWGVLYSCSPIVLEVKIRSLPKKSEAASSDVAKLTPRRHNMKNYEMRRAMTSMVLSLDIIRLVSDFTQSNCSLLSDRNLSCLLDSLEASYFYARSFNDNLALRSALKDSNLMVLPDPGALPHLHEQEKLSITQLFLILFRLAQSYSCHSNDEEKSKAHCRSTSVWSRLRRLIHILLLDYICLHDIKYSIESRNIRQLTEISDRRGRIVKLIEDRCCSACCDVTSNNSRRHLMPLNVIRDCNDKQKEMLSKWSSDLLIALKQPLSTLLCGLQSFETSAVDKWIIVLAIDLVRVDDADIRLLVSDFLLKIEEK